MEGGAEVERPVRGEVVMLILGILVGLVFVAAWLVGLRIRRHYQRQAGCFTVCHTCNREIAWEDVGR